LEATSDNKALLAALVPGDELLLRMSTGPAYRFAYVDAVRVAPQASEIFRQTRPGLTLTLLAESQQSTRIVLRARYLPDSDLGNTGTMAAASISPGQPIDLGSIRLTVREHRPVVQADTPPGHVYVAITYEARNIDESLPLLPGAFTQRLEAGGLTWPLAPGTKQTTANLRPGEALTTTVTYIVPEPALAEPLRWTFAPDPAGPTGQMDLAPFADQLEPEVAITEATRQADRLTLQLHIKTALRAVRLTANDLMVEGAQLDTINYFPWQVAPGTEGKFTLVLQPQQELVRLGLLGQGFEVTD
jgi:hypothetical protein